MEKPSLANPKKTIEILQKYGLSFKKRYGQNFLTDEHVLDKIMAISGITKDDMVLEIGPGIGTMTQYLSRAAGRVVAVEIDRALIPVLDETLSGYDNVTIICDDILKVDINKLADTYNAGKPVKVVANLPYYITTPVLMSLYESRVPLDTITVMVQKEVAKRIKALPGSKEYGALSLAIGYYARPYLAANVPRNCFIPRPAVDSAVMLLTPHKEPPVNVPDEKLLFRIIRASFQQRRKTLANALKHSLETVLSGEEISQAVAELGGGEDVRGEMLSLGEFSRLSGIIKRKEQYHEK